MAQPPFEIFSVPTWLRVLTWSGTYSLRLMAKSFSFFPASNSSSNNSFCHSPVTNFSVEKKDDLFIDGISNRENISIILAWPPPVVRNPQTDATLIECCLFSFPFLFFGSKSTLIETLHWLQLKVNVLQRPSRIISFSSLGVSFSGQQAL